MSGGRPTERVETVFERMSEDQKRRYGQAEAEAVHAMYSRGGHLPEGMDVADERRAYERRVGVGAAHVPTIVRPKNTEWMMLRLRERIAGRVVVEIGAGLGILAVEMARYARRVFAIESDPVWTGKFSRGLYRKRPTNLTWIFDTAQGVLKSGLGAAMGAEVAVVVTGSGEEALRRLAEKFVRSPADVVMPWQDYNGGRAVVDYRGQDPTAERWPLGRKEQENERP